MVTVDGLPEAVQKKLGETTFALEECPTLKEILSRREMAFGEQGDDGAVELLDGTEVGAWVAVPLFRASWVAGLLFAGQADSRRVLTRRQRRLAHSRPLPQPRR